MLQVLTRLGPTRGLSIKVAGGKGSGVIASFSDTRTSPLNAALFCGSVGIFFFNLLPPDNGSYFLLTMEVTSADSRVRLGSASGEVAKLQPSERWKTSPRGERHYKALMEGDLSSCSCPHVLTDVGARCSFIAMPREVRPRVWIYSARVQGPKFTSDITKKCTGDVFAVEIFFSTLDSSFLFHITVALIRDSVRNCVGKMHRI